MNQITIIRATTVDRDDLFAWRNDPLTQRVSKNSVPIKWETHVAWFAASLASPDRTIYIGYSGTSKIGSIRFDRIGSARHEFLVSIMIAPEQRGRGFGGALLRAGIDTLPDALLKAEIAADNFASRRIFEACGFEQIPDSTDCALLQYHRAPRRSER